MYSESQNKGIIAATNIFKRFVSSSMKNTSSNTPQIDATSFSPTSYTSSIDSFGRAYGTGRRKTSVARVWIKSGSGIFTVNNQRFIDYFQPAQREHAIESFLVSSTAGNFDVWCTVKGGGMSGKATRSIIVHYFLFRNPL